MHITKVELENIKSHIDSTFEFSRGTTAITGGNGAGKTTIIEAVAWTLFDLLDYKKDDFVRRGEKKGTVRVTFESNLDERLYTVTRDTGTAYNVVDSAIGVRIADKKEEVIRFLWQHLGVEAGTDLESLFRRAIGVPQGTFTAIFLESATERKRAFDKLLKVEEYRRGADELLRTTRYLDGEISRVNVSVARAEGQLADFDTVTGSHKRFSDEKAELTVELEQCRADLESMLVRIRVLDEQEAKAAAAGTKVDELRAESAKAEIVMQHKRSGLDQSREAKALVADAKADAEKYSEMLGRLKELDRERTAREQVRAEVSNVEQALSNVNAEMRHAKEMLENAQKAHSQLAELRLPALDQERVEDRIRSLRDRIATAKAQRSRIDSLDSRIKRLREDYRSGKIEFDNAAEKAKAAAGLTDLQIRDAEIVRELARLRASLERDESFQREIKNGLCPILSQKCLNLGEGETLEGFVTSQFAELREQILSFETESKSVTAELAVSREADRSASQLAALEKRLSEIGDEGKRLGAEKESLEKEAGIIADTEAELAGAETEFKTLDDPKGKIKILEAEVSREGEFRQKLSDIERNLERLETDRSIVTEKIGSYENLDEQLREASDMRDRTEPAYRVFIANEAAAEALDSRQKELEKITAEHTALREKQAVAEQEFEKAAAEYDRDQHQKERTELLETRTRETEIRVRLENATRREAELAAELERLSELRKQIREEFRERERLEKVAEATTFIRDTLKDAAPRVARNYVFHVSVEANQLYREITGNPERTLKWSEDYGIILEESGYERPFVSLSGGEQMAAAMSVRLALLKQLSDIRIAFFDEPTANMDAERRENLAQQIGRIGHFEQLFVISHDDTFEGYMDNEIIVESV